MAPITGVAPDVGIGKGIKAFKWVGKLGKATKFQNHHVIPNQAYRLFRKELGQIGWHQNHVLNLKKLPVPFHGNHPAYNTYIIKEMNLLKRAGELNLSTMQNLQFEARQLINQAYKSGGTLNSYFVH